MPSELDIRTDGALGRIALNRPQAINALSLSMIEGVLAALTGWRDDPSIGAVLFTGNGPRGFCAGGDVRAVRAMLVAGQPEAADRYFSAEYRMNGLIAGYRKPVVSISHGVTMGGGIGVAGHCRVRIAQPGARYAMPEGAIGFFADVGVTAILAEAPRHRALLFLMSGASVGAADAVALGLADAVVAADRIAPLIAGLAAASRSRHAEAAIARLLAAETMSGGEAPFCALADLLPTTAPTSPAAFIADVAAEPALRDIAALLRGRSPGSLLASFHALERARQAMDVTATLDTDLRLAAVMARRADFAEGVRAVLVDKDFRPSWSPARLEDFDSEADAGPILAALALR